MIESQNKEYYIGGSKFNVIYGDIIEVKSDVTVSSDDNFVSMGGGVSRRILNEGGIEIQFDAQKHTDLKLGDVLVTTAGRLSSKYIFHAITIDFNTGDIVNVDVLEEILARILELGKSLRIRSITLPAIGTGTAGFELEQAVKTTTETISEFLYQNTCIDEINLCLLPGVANNEDMNALFEGAVEFASITKQNKEIRDLLTGVNSTLKERGSVDKELISRLEVGLKHIDEIEMGQDNTIAVATIPHLLEDLQFLEDLYHNINNHKHTIEQLKEDKKVSEQALNYYNSALRHYEIEKAKYGGEMVPFQLITNIEDAKKGREETLNKITSINDELNNFLQA
ncbi:macro domain-containing protein [Flammeovirga agarivorans]|uniref:Macro domain-containing protein n=1 Tax=Flammeovirga agarivorans TaxID=2726742 RepID=A0A7X8SK00_9BACT|nr:macro domain-containing protein [Flammeovirga agarivorans]NLR91537.1 hypothetical protein [Flammeovirga agarivorans]